jgi:hypothetical protein
MTKLAFAFEEGGEKRLEVTWKGIHKYKDITVTLDGAQVGIIPDHQAFLAGKEFQLIDRSIIRVQLVQKFETKEVQVFRNGQPLPGSAADPKSKLKSAYQVVYFIAAANMVLGLISFFYKWEILRRMGFGIASVLYGLVFLVLAFFIQRRWSLALILAIVVYITDSVLGVYFNLLEGSKISSEGLLLRVAFLVAMFQGFSAMKALKAKTQEEGV